MGAPCQRNQGGLCLHPQKRNSIFLYVSLHMAFKDTAAPWVISGEERYSALPLLNAMSISQHVCWPKDLHAAKEDD